jgi:NAD(P)-dependent dehydrogenase (short-subunit alcohol dehydrogenase family)
MKLRLKKLCDQVVVLTGASSGIGLVTAREAAAVASPEQRHVARIDRSE